MNILVACEESQAVTIELRKLGHNAFSCDVMECSGGHPEWHIQQNVLPLLNGKCSFQTQDIVDGMESIYSNHMIKGKWDMIIAFPPCTDLCVSGARHFAKKQADGRQQASIEFFMKFANADCNKIIIENPVGIMSTHYKKPDQIIQPYEFGDPYKKTTCLWLKGVEKLKATNVVEVCDLREYNCKNGTIARFSRTLVKGGKDRQKNRSRTFLGIAKAMAIQFTK